MFYPILGRIPQKMKLKNCNFCGACAIQHTHPDVNYKGESGYKSTVNCSKCIKHIERWAKIKEAAEQMAANNWNGYSENLGGEWTNVQEI